MRYSMFVGVVERLMMRWYGMVWDRSRLVEKLGKSSVAICVMADMNSTDIV